MLSKGCNHNAFTNMTTCTVNVISTAISDHEAIVAVIKITRDMPKMV